tara:strand:+ start:262 stop:1245 length:984 start_codon:yes stop_codon:yes gene_type:complete
MPTYSCELCNYNSSLLGNYKQHLKTKKHITNDDNLRYENAKNNEITSKTLQNPPILEKNPPKPSGNPPFFAKNPPKPSGKDPVMAGNQHQIADLSIAGNQHQIADLSNNPSKFYICEHCNTEFSRKDNLKRHLETRCKLSKKEPVVDYKEMFYLMKDELEKEKEEFKKQISILLEKVGNTTTNITNTQNIQLNSYGNEDLSHITDSLKTELLKVPFGMIPKMIKEVHFNENKPENKNIALTNKKDNKIMVFSNNKWVYRNKNDTINDLVDCKYFILDNHYQDLENNNSISKDNKITYEKFKTYFDEGDKKIVEEIKKDCELLLLNNR